MVWTAASTFGLLAMTKEKYDLIIFDCDGTLTDSERAYNECSVDVFREYGLDFTVDYALKNWMGKSQDDIVRLEEEKNGISLPLQDIKNKFIINTPAYLGKYLRPIPGALEAVRELHKNFKCCVASNGERQNVIASLELLNFTGLFDGQHVFTKDDVPRAKPFPDLFLHACKVMNLTPERSIIIEDSVSGVRAARASGGYTIGFNGVDHHNLQSDGKLKEAGADIVFSDWKDILDHINSL
ncbi:MAG: HAD family hydrolase [Micavibrio aeruginosavorus]|uniref:HAD family hydrolase n=1 Tax=Micavibrio aeruginosavorus TaxID=349221 RepID=A0A2W5FLF4_9BACT|nr:MAG: HAD family hydrolase [Micavibrio aeruginosavorus]